MVLSVCPKLQLTPLKMSRPNKSMTLSTSCLKMAMVELLLRLLDPRPMEDHGFICRSRRRMGEGKMTAARATVTCGPARWDAADLISDTRLGGDATTAVLPRRGGEEKALNTSSGLPTGAVRGSSCQDSGGCLGGATYLQFLQDVLLEYLEEVPLGAREAMWSQQDGAPPHFAVAVRWHLDMHFPNSVAWLAVAIHISPISVGSVRHTLASIINNGVVGGEGGGVENVGVPSEEQGEFES
ncbi:hypothetical protein PR048_019022 [Dryococelus australis]|uniref:Transposase n=1 Tax=Dryococelus australis TaxID=614101 RepID=A0ABQ9H2B1_9NEOP|nr:hypothetical protein PR048_019022 [Dryococelus australis]